MFQLAYYVQNSDHLTLNLKGIFFFLVLCSTGFGHFSLLLMFCLDNEKVQEQITYIEF